MLIKMLKHGTGSGRDAVLYLLGKFDHKGIERAEVTVLRGDPHLVGKIADSLEFVNRYSSGVIAFAKEDNPTQEQIDELIDAHESMCFAGLDKSRFARTYVLHREDDGSAHIHFLVARVDLQTGKSFNIAPPGWENDIAPMREFFNRKYQWSDPDDPANARIAHQNPKGRGSIERTKNALTNFIADEIKEGRITDRAGIEAAFVGLGYEVNRRGEDYLSIKAATGEKFRFKGGIYREDFRIRETGAEVNLGRAAESPEENRRKQIKLLERIKERIRKRAEFNQYRYRSRGDEGRDTDEGGRSEVPRSRGEIERNRDQAAEVNRPGATLDDGNDRVGDRASDRVDPDPQNVQQLNPQPQQDEVPNDNPNSPFNQRPPASRAGLPSLQKFGSVHHHARLSQSVLFGFPHDLVRQHRGRGGDLNVREDGSIAAGVSHDTDRDYVAQIIEAIDRAGHAARVALNRATQSVANVVRDLGQSIEAAITAGGNLGAASSAFNGAAIKMTERLEAERLAKEQARRHEEAHQERVREQWVQDRQPDEETRPAAVRPRQKF